MKTALALLALASAPAFAGQVSQRPTNLGPVKIRPDIAIPASPLLLLRERREVFDIPAQIVEFAAPALWSPPLTHIPGAPRSALVVERTRGPAQQTCSAFIDRIHLRGAKLNGFRLVAYSAEPMGPRSGHVLQQPLEAIATQITTPDTSTSDLPSADQIRIRPPIYVRQQGTNRSCWSRYRLSITLEGPRNVADPFKTNRPGGGRHRDDR